MGEIKWVKELKQIILTDHSIEDYISFVEKEKHKSYLEGKRDLALDTNDFMDWKLGQTVDELSNLKEKTK